MLTGVTKTYDTFTAVDNVDLTIPQGSFFALLGPSGCGKTTTLRMVAGPRAANGGHDLHRRPATSPSTKPYQRNVNTVFQTYALFPHLDVLENVAFGLKRRGDQGRDEPRRWRRSSWSQLGARRAARSRPSSPVACSSGSPWPAPIVNRPDVLLLDEPLGALDLKLRRQMQIELKRIQQEVGITFVHVTHDQEEAMTMADTIAVMNAGQPRAARRPGHALRAPRVDLRGELPRPVQPAAGDPSRASAARSSPCDVARPSP